MTAIESNTNASGLHGAFASTAEPATKIGQAQTSDKKRRKKPNTYVTIRVTPEEEERLRANAGNASLSDYVRDRLLGEDAKPRKARGRYVVKDKQSLALILRTIGGAPFSNRMHRLILAHEESRIGLDCDLEKDLRAMAWDIAVMRNALVKALGLKPLPPPGKTDHVTFTPEDD